MPSEMENCTSIMDNGTMMYRDSSGNKAEAVILFIVACLSTIGNMLSVLVILIYNKFRKTSLAILCHHCFLDFVKSFYCFPISWTLFTSREIQLCGLIGSSYVLLMTTSAYNLLALVVNVEYELLSSKSASSGYCTLFGVCIIWFVSLLLNLGISIIPSNTFYIQSIGNCTFSYGEWNSYVLHILWITLVSFAIVLSFKSFCQLYRRVSNQIRKYKWWSLHQSVCAEDQDVTSELLITDGYRQIATNKIRSRYQYHLRRILIYISMVTSFALFWYPLFLLTAVDVYFKEPKSLYRFLTLFAWSHPVLTPVFSVVILRDIKFQEDVIRDISSNLIPLRDKRHWGEAHGAENEHFVEMEHEPSHVHPCSLEMYPDNCEPLRHSKLKPKLISDV